LPFPGAAHIAILLERQALEAELVQLQSKIPALPSAMVIKERAHPRTTHVMLGGDFTRKGAVVTPGTPAVLHPMHAASTSRSPNRLDLARWLVDPKNPLTARVIVNRFWQFHFGTGIVETDNDFGTQGTRPSYPELLDWLASEFMSRGWSMKAIHRLIV